MWKLIKKGKITENCDHGSCKLKSYKTCKKKDKNLPSICFSASFDRRMNSLLCSRVFHTENQTFIIMVKTQTTNSTLYHPNPLSELKKSKQERKIKKRM